MKSMKGNQPSEPLKKNPRGRPVTYVMPEPIPDAPENIARIFMNSPVVPKGDVPPDVEFGVAAAPWPA